MWDFKGLQGGPHTVEFDTKKYVSLLCGPNGYGKSTIFDAIELCLTGKVSRIEKSKDGRHEDGRSAQHKKSPLHNNPANSFKLELEFEVDGHSRTLQLEKSMNGRRETLAQYAEYIDIRLKGDGSSNFVSIANHQDLTQKLGLNSVATTYQLLTYMSQDEADLFLRTKQQKRQEWLSELTDTREQRDMLDELEKYQRSLSKSIGILEGKIKSLSPITSIKTSVAPYVDLLMHMKGVEKNPFDLQNPYAKLQPNTLDKVHESFVAEVSKLDKFASTFDVEEYAKYKKYAYLATLTKENGVMAALAAKLLHGERPDEIKHIRQTHLLYKELFESGKLKYLFVRDIITKETLPEYVSAYTDYSAYTDILYFIDDNTWHNASSQDVLRDFSANTAVPHDDLYQIAKELWLQYSKLSQSAANYSKLISKLATARDELQKCQHDLDQHNKQSSGKCVYCGHDWQANESLASAYAEQSALLKDLLKGDGKKLKDIIDTAQKTVIEPLKDRHKKLQAMHDTFAYSYAFNGSTEVEIVDTTEVSALLKAILPVFLHDHPTLKTPLEGRQFTEALSDYRKNLSANINMDTVNFYRKLAGSTQGMNIEPHVTALAKAGFKTDLTAKALLTLAGFEKYIQDLKEELTRFATTFTYNPASVTSDNVIIFKKYFGELNEVLVDWLKNASKLIPAKLAYLSDQYATMRNKDLVALKSKYGKLKEHESELRDGIITKCRDELRLYENSQARALQIPFYVISARILQSSPHGEGGLVIKPQKDKDNSKSLIVGVPGETQDVINQLSSGQLMVVALAFFLALNIRNRGRNAAKLLLLDDPVQDMDSLNSHALVDVLRREFISAGNEYQLIISTSSDIQMNLMKYKMHLSGDSIFKVQDNFFKTAEKA